MRIAFYAPMKQPSDPVPSGDRTVARLFVEALRRGGAEVEVASVFRSRDRGDPARQERLATIGAKLARRLVRRFEREPGRRPDLWFTYHLYHKAPDHLGPAVARALGIPYVVAEASRALKRRTGTWAPGFAAADVGIASAAVVFSFSEADAEGLRRAEHPPKRIVDLRPFLDTSAFRAGAPARDDARARLVAELGLEPAVPILLTVAMMRPDQKLASYAVLAEAFALLGDRTFQAVLVGTGAAECEVRRLMAPFGERIRFAGERGADWLRLAYRGADLLVWPAVKEAFGMVFLEAAASGVPIVAGRSYGIDRILDDGHTGLVVPAGDAAATAAAIRRLVDDPDAARRMGEAAADDVARRNDLAIVARLIRRELDAAIAAHRVPA